MSAGIEGSLPQQTRLTSLDAYRGFVMLLMASAGLGLGAVADRDPENILLGFLGTQVEHAEWRGCTVWDLIQPSFMFLVGASIPFSVASRRAKGASKASLFKHAMFRSAVLVFLGIFLASNGSKQTDWTFTNVLAQIGLGYGFVFLLSFLRPGLILAAIVVILGADWLAFYLYNFPMGETFQPSLHGWTVAWRPMIDLFFHWEKNVNIAWAFDRWFLNLFPRPDGAPFRYNPGGYTTLNFVPSMGTMLFGVLAGKYLQRPKPPGMCVTPLFLAAVAAIVIGKLLDLTCCPSVKRIWTPSWTVYSTGWALLMLAFFVRVFDAKPRPRLAFPLVVVGANSIVMYLMAQLMKPWIRSTLKTHLTTARFALGRAIGADTSTTTGASTPGVHATTSYLPIAESAIVLLCMWLICLWLYRRKIFVKI